MMKIFYRKSWKLKRDTIQPFNNFTYPLFGFSKFSNSKLLLYFYRELDQHDTFVIVINFGDNTGHVNLTNTFTKLPIMLKVVAAGSNSTYKIDEKINSTNLLLGQYESLVLSSNANCIGMSITGLIIFISIAFTDSFT